MKKWQKIIGFSILILSCILWGLILVIPFLHFSGSETAGLLAALIIAGEITFYLSILLLGKSIITKIKSYLTFWKREKIQDNTLDV
jgi:hypothetical protein